MSTEIQTPSAGEPARGQSRGRSVAVWIVLVLAGILLLLSTFAVWMNRVALNTDEFTDTSYLAARQPRDPKRDRNPGRRRAVRERRRPGGARGQLPEDYKGLSGRGSAGLREASYRIVNRALEQPVFQRLFEIASKRRTRPSSRCSRAAATASRHRTAR